MAGGDFTRINTNIGALNALNSLKYIQGQLGMRQLRLATGKRINEAADDPAGLTIATKFKYRSDGLSTALDNVGDAKNMLAVAEGGLQKINDILVEMRNKTLQAASDSLGSAERSAIYSQLNSYASQIDSIASETQWNGVNLLGTGATTVRTFQTGANSGETTQFNFSQAFDKTTLGVQVSSTGTQTATLEGTNSDMGGVATSTVASGGSELGNGQYRVNFSDATHISLYDQFGNQIKLGADATGKAVAAPGSVTQFVSSLDISAVGAGGTIDTGKGFKFTLTAAGAGTAGANYYVDYTSTGGSVSTGANATTYLSSIDTAIANVSAGLSSIGAMTARLSFKEDTLSVAKVNTEAAFSRIMNADMASEQLEATKLNILQQTATAMLAQANQAPSGIMQLFR